MIRTRAVCPGALDYMGPEVLKRSPSYGCELDAFSFGHLTIYLVNQEVPSVSDSMVMVEHVQNKQREVNGKHRKALDQMSQQLGDSRHPLYSTVVQCLSDTPHQRPTSRILVKRMEEICKQHPIPHENTLQTLTDLIEKHKLVTTLREEVAAKDHQFVELTAKMKLNDDELQAKHYELERLQSELILIQAKASLLVRVDLLNCYTFSSMW